MKYLKITTGDLNGIEMVSDDYTITTTGNFTIIENTIYDVWYDDDTIKIYDKSNKPFYEQISSIQSSCSKNITEISQKEYDSILNELKERRIVNHIEKPKEPYMIDVEHSTNTCIKVVPKPGFEVGKKELYRWVYFETMGAAYPMPFDHYFENKPYEINIDLNQYEGYEFVPEESTIEKSVYKVVWPTEKDFEKTKLVYR